MKKFVKVNSLSIVLVLLFLLFLLGQAVTGFAVSNQELQDHGQPVETFGRYLASGHFAEAVFENWESEFLQMAAYVILTVFLFQRGSAESKNPDKFDAIDTKASSKNITKNSPWPVRRGGVAKKLYDNSLFLAFLILFLLSFGLHAVHGSRANCEEGILHAQGCEAFAEYVTGPQFWFESFQNWQSEFLAVACIVIFSIFLRQQGSPESKPVYESHKTTV